MNVFELLSTAQHIYRQRASLILPAPAHGCWGLTRHSGMAEPERTDPPSSATRMHLLPCAVDYTGPANVNAYFRPTATGQPPASAPTGSA